jgi:hypothetical protein
MVFIGGPRQVGKTTLAKSFLNSHKQYLTWDDLEDRTQIKSHKLDSNLKTIVLDVVHLLASYEADSKLKRNTTEDLLRYGGFQEPFSKKNFCHLHYFKTRLPIPIFYQVHHEQVEWDDGNILVRRFETFWKDRILELMPV